MELDTPHCIQEPCDSSQREMAEVSMPNEDILIINRGTNVGIGLGDLGIRRGPLSIIYCHQGIRDSVRGCICSEDE